MAPIDDTFQVLRGARRIVIKVGSSLVTNDGRGLDEAAIGEWCRQMSLLVGDKREVIMVSSGAIAEGMKRLGWVDRPRAINELQAAAAVGQMGLAQMYETKLRENGLGSAQVLLTHADLADRERYLNARSTLLTLLKLGVVPVINENDTVVNDEIKFGDNAGCVSGQPGGGRCPADPDRPTRALQCRSAQGCCRQVRPAGQGG
jgi:glutamate 5-kinase